jgi:hydrogenase maturation factor HypF (carbamoyltransferase family)
VISKATVPAAAIIAALSVHKESGGMTSSGSPEWLNQQSVIDVLTAKTSKAAKQYGVKQVLLAGGVAANKDMSPGSPFQKQRFRQPQSSLHCPCIKKAAG